MSEDAKEATRKFVFVTVEGRTKAPTRPGMEGEDEDCENCQELGTAEGLDQHDAWSRLKAENPWIEDLGFGQEGVLAYELVSIIPYEIN
jgi:hypothetical protein